MNKIKAIIVDDERSAREELKRAARKYVDIEIIAEAKNADEAQKTIEGLKPDLVFLDIQMSEVSGFELLESLNEVPEIIFITAYDQYAVKAFEVNALDYLMKPVRDERFAIAVEKIRERLNKKLESNSTQTDNQIFIKDGEECYFVRIGDIYLIESLHNYSQIYFEKKKACLKKSLNQWEELLDSEEFFRINRTQIINMQHIGQIHSKERGKLQIVLKTGQLLEVSSRQSVKFKNIKRI